MRLCQNKHSQLGTVHPPAVYWNEQSSWKVHSTRKMMYRNCMRCLLLQYSLKEAQLCVDKLYPNKMLVCLCVWERNDGQSEWLHDICCLNWILALGKDECEFPSPLNHPSSTFLFYFTALELGFF